MNYKVVRNAKWIVGCKIVRSLIGLIIGMITVRYLGPSNYGIISYVSSIVAFAMPIMQLGLKDVLVKEFVNSPQIEGTILGTSLVLNIISSLFCMVGTVTFVMLVNAGETETIIVCALYSLTLLFNATELTQYWFQAKLMSKYPSVATLVAYIAASLYKIFLLVTQKNIVWFALSNVIEYFLISLLLMIVYKKLGCQKLSVDWKLGKRLLSTSKYYIIPNLMIMVFQHTDRIMIKLMVGEAETGFYSAAITCIGISGFFFTAVIDSARPVILEEQVKSHRLFEKRIMQLYSIITIFSLIQSVGMTLFAKPLVYLMYGAEYLRSADILAISVWYTAFGYWGTVRDIWILAENKQKYLLWINLVGAIGNVILNFCFIPAWGAIGAAIASVCTQLFMNVILGFILKPIRRNNWLMIKSFDSRIIRDLLRKTM